ncbi:MAG: hypothetical protein BWY89_01789 [Bacteroidetes bacterium ADurb.BinA012]|nr:MAG: hypothetical protein BWY89_01789 [Bacteroidetes bacterium ADurb.BinA012]
MLNGAVVLYLTITTVVVGEQQAVRRDDLSGTAASEDDDGVFDACLVDAVNVFRCQFESHPGHSADIQLLDERQQPHALISPGLRG